jgi:peptidyl-prolyl cis-trans isomerase SurA
MRNHFSLAVAVFVTAVLSTPLMQLATAAEQSLLAVVNEQAITSRDIESQIKLNSVLGGSQSTSRKKALDDLVDQIVKIGEASRYKFEPSERDIDGRIAEIAKGLGTDGAGLQARIEKQGISLPALRQYVAAQISFARLIRFKYKVDFKVTDAEVDSKLAEIKAEINGRIQKVMKDPRMQPIQVASLIEINFPIEQADTGMDQLLQSRALEANQYISKFTGCKAAKSAAQGIFNVKITKQFDADMRKIPKPLRAALEKRGPGSAIGPMRSKAGIQVLAYCGQRTIKQDVPKVALPTRDQARQILLNERYEAVENKYLAQMRRGAIIEYKDAAVLQ